jgi:hypothetical protein
MATNDDLLHQETHKGDVEEVSVRVFYTLTDKSELQVHRTAKAVGLIVEILRQKNLMTDVEIDEFLFACVR